MYDEDEYEEDDMDLALNGNGDIVIDSMGNLMLLGDDESISRQRAAFTLFVNSPDYVCFPDFGANLDTLLGKTLNENTLDLGIELLMSAIPDISDVYGVLNDEYNSIIFFITHPSFETPIALIYAMEKGLLLGEEAEGLLHELFLED